MLALPDPRKPDRANPPTDFWLSLFDSTGMIYMHWVPTGQAVNNEYNVEVLREFRKRFCQKRPAFFKSSQWHFHHDNTPVHNSILVTDYLTKMGIKTVRHPPYSPDLAPCYFWLFPKLKEKLRGTTTQRSKYTDRPTHRCTYTQSYTKTYIHTQSHTDPDADVPTHIATHICTYTQKHTWQSTFSVSVIVVKI